MGGRYKAYPEYKDSGVEWLGDVPQDWIVCRIKDAAILNASKSEVRNLPADLQVSFIPMEAIGERGELDTSRTKCMSEVLAGYTYIADGDLMIAKITPCFENGKGAVATGLTNGIGFATTEVISIRPIHAADCKFFYYLLNCNPFKFMAESSMYGAGGQKRVADSFVAEYHFAFPPKNGRLDIANFLDHETAKIDTLIEKQQQLIQLLKEKRQTVISHAVTKGLNPNAKMRDSGVEWLGEVPEHWMVTKIGWLCSNISYGFTNPMPSTDEGPFMLTATDIEFGRVNYDQARRTSRDAYDRLLTDKSKPIEGDILLTKDGTLGRVAVFRNDNEVCVSQSVALLRLNSSLVVPEFMCMALSGADYQRKMIFDAGGTTIKHIYISILAKMNFVLPTVLEQLELLTALNERLEKVDQLIAEAEKASVLLIERRTALISAAVTGKIDVRDWVAPTPDHRNEEAA